MKFRIEHDSMGEIKVQDARLWAAQTQRSLENFRIGEELMPQEIIRALGAVKAACANVNVKEGKLDKNIGEAIYKAAMQIYNGKYSEDFPLAVWQTGSGTQTNMNVNEVISAIVKRDSGLGVHPNDHVNMSQSSNDTFPTAIHLAAIKANSERLLPALKKIIGTLGKLSDRYMYVVKIGRTHLQDAVPMSFGQEIGGWEYMLKTDLEMIEGALKPLYEPAIGGTAVGTGINAPANFGEKVCTELYDITGIKFKQTGNHFAGLASKSPVVTFHGTIKALACDMMKIAGDIRWLASGPRAGIGEITIPANEPGSSIMPGKVNPTQCEAISMAACQVMGNDVAIATAASQGHFQLNTYMPLIAYNLLQSIRLMADSIKSFDNNCCKGIKPKEDVMKSNLENSLMLVTALNTHIGYENSAKIAKLAYEKDITLKEAAIELEILTEEEFDTFVKIEEMIWKDSL